MMKAEEKSRSLRILQLEFIVFVLSSFETMLILFSANSMFSTVFMTITYWTKTVFDAKR